MKVSLISPIEPLTVEVAGKTVMCLVDLTAENRLRIAQASGESGRRFGEIYPLIEERTKQCDIDGINAINDEMAELIKAPIVLAIGENSYNEILNAATQDKTIPARFANDTMTALLNKISAMINDRTQAALNLSATQNPQRGNIASPTFNTAR